MASRKRKSSAKGSTTSLDDYEILSDTQEEHESESDEVSKQNKGKVKKGKSHGPEKKKAKGSKPCASKRNKQQSPRCPIPATAKQRLAPRAGFLGAL